jgi:hypothetical protein
MTSPRLGKASDVLMRWNEFLNFVFIPYDFDARAPFPHGGREGEGGMVRAY